MPPQRVGAVHGVDRRHHAAQHQAAGDSQVGHQGLQDRRGIREPAGFDDDAIELGKRAAVAAAEHVRERFCQVVADLAAQASGLQLDETVVAGLDELVIEADLAEFVDEDGGARELGPAQQMGQQGRLAAAEKAGQDRNRDHDGTCGETAIRTRLFGV